MSRRANLVLLIGIIGSAFVVLSISGSAAAIQVKKEIYGGGGGEVSRGPAPPNPLTPALRRNLADTLASESDSYLGQESEKKASGEPYIDLESAKFRYIPRNVGGKIDVTAELEGAEYKRAKDATGKGRPTGKRKKLVFKYKLEGQNWVEQGEPVWQDVEKKAAKR
jgi:hypothetical protein